MTLGETDTTGRQRRHLSELAIAQATQGDWEAAVATNRELLELGADTDEILAAMGYSAEDIARLRAAGVL